MCFSICAILPQPLRCHGSICFRGVYMTATAARSCSSHWGYLNCHLHPWSQKDTHMANAWNLSRSCYSNLRVVVVRNMNIERHLNGGGGDSDCIHRHWRDDFCYRTDVSLLPSRWYIPSTNMQYVEPYILWNELAQATSLYREWYANGQRR